jgi:hypothetical protein
MINIRGRRGRMPGGDSRVKRFAIHQKWDENIENFSKDHPS